MYKCGENMAKTYCGARAVFIHKYIVFMLQTLNSRNFTKSYDVGERFVPTTAHVCIYKPDTPSELH